MTRVWPTVSALKWAKSSGMCHGIRPWSPITRLAAYAATATMRRPVPPPAVTLPSDGNGRLDAGVGVVALDPDVVEVEAVDRRHGGFEHQLRQRTRVAGQLETG